MRRSLRIVTPISVVLLALSLAFEFTDWLPNLLFGPGGRRGRFIPADMTTPIAAMVSLLALLVCGVVALNGDEVARRRQPITWHTVINGVVLFASACLSILTMRLG